MPFNAFATHRSIEQGVPSTKLDPMAPDGAGIRRGADECAIPPLDIRVQAIRFSLIAQALQARILHVFRYLPLY